MAQQSSIEWTETTWNPVVGCSKVSSGCANCYAERMANRLSLIATALVNNGKRPGRTQLYQEVINHRGRWNGKIAYSEDALDDPYSWRTPRKVFVNSMSDLFHENVSDLFIKRVFHVMNENAQHSFQILTKRPERAMKIASTLCWSPNIWMGTSVENAAVTNRIDHLIQIPAKIRFLSIEPLLGPISDISLEGIHWVIVGGESGPGARLMEAVWVEELRDICVKEGVPFFFKQWGGVQKKNNGRLLEGQAWNQMPNQELAYA